MKVKEFNNLESNIIWAVDDSWFDTTLNSLPINTSITPSIDDCLTLSQLKDAIENCIKQKNPSADLIYLKHLIEVCLENKLRLNLCDFPYFEENFSVINHPNSAVLLDCHNKLAVDSEEQATIYGVNSLARLLQGKRPRADIFFVTGHPNKVSKAIENARALSTWWPLRAIPIVEKNANKIQSELKTFATYFIQGLEKDPFRQLAKLYLHIYKDPLATHPNDLNYVKNNLHCYPFILREEELSKDSLLGSIKALYHWDRRDRRPQPIGGAVIDSAIVRNVCTFLNVTLKVEPDESKLHLPVTPGIIFLLYFCKFVTSLDASDKLRPRLDITSEASNYYKAVLSISTENTEAFKASILSSRIIPGQAKVWFENTIFCRSDGLYELTSVADQSPLPWRQFPLYPNNRVDRMAVDPDISINEVCFKWEFKLNVAE